MTNPPTPSIPKRCPFQNFSEAVAPSEVDDGDKWKGPLKKLVSPLTAEIIIANKVGQCV